MTTELDSDNEDGCFGNEEDDDGFKEDIEALRRACMLSGTGVDEFKSTARSSSSPVAGANVDSFSGSGSGSEDDLALVRNIHSRFSMLEESCQTFLLKPPRSLQPELSDGDEDDLEFISAIKRRFAAYDENNNGEATGLCSNDKARSRSSTPFEWRQAHPSKFPKLAYVFFDAIKQNRAYQRFLRSKLIQIEARLEENKKLKECFKIIEDIQVSSKKSIGRLVQRNDPRIQLISGGCRSRHSDHQASSEKASKVNIGPKENSHVANYHNTLKRFPLTFNRKKWTQAESENIAKGIKQQFQEMVFESLVRQCRGPEAGPPDCPNGLDSILSSVQSMEITPEKIREFLPNVNWDRLASTNVPGRSGAECESRWLNWEDELINQSSWTAKEEKHLLFLVQEKGVTNWFEKAISLGTNRTPFDCLAHFQRSLNAQILKREWTKEEDDKLRTAVEIHGEHDWQSVAAMLDGRTGPQCSNRWLKSINVEKKGKWNAEETKQLRIAIKLFGPKDWKKNAQFVPGRSHVQCRERWTNCLNPSLNFGAWTEEEDQKLKEATQKHGYAWSKVAKDIAGRTDRWCKRRWVALAPDEVPLMKAAKRIRKSALIGNFVDRESERPALGPEDFILRPLQDSSAVATGAEKPSLKPPRNNSCGRKKKAGQASSSKVKKKTEGMEVAEDGAVVGKKKRTQKPRGKTPLFVEEEDQEEVAHNGDDGCRTLKLLS